MTHERRRHPRHARPFDGSWRGASGGSPCRITDVSISGCFVESKVAPARDEATVVLIRVVDGPTLELPGRARYADPSIGFGVEFENLSEEQFEALRSILPASS